MRSVLFILALVLSSACIAGKSCENPYTLVYGDCCLDEDSDGICDSDKPVCNPPYMLKGVDCCLDEDSDGICDSDKTPTTTNSEATASTQATTTSSTQATTTSLPAECECVNVSECTSYSDIACDDRGRAVTVHYTPIICSDGECVYRSSQEISRYSCGYWERCVDGLGCVPEENVSSYTTTTLKYTYSFEGIVDRVSEKASMTTTTTTLAEMDCFDDDGGRRYGSRSVNVSGYYYDNKTAVYSISEHCIGSDVIEYYCESGVLESIRHTCAGECVDGRCCGKPTDTCTGDRDCCSGQCKSRGILKYCL
ncbi:MAG: hypothetical protein GF416_02795 [Candidatus Altiarchaeales archaeon]|nr:hypothetical protein [Candidatus Altiarchaeales archaeon]MBD3416047.1 hypothetical protein [Candidatus Altiarchaeales archaeon]